MLTAICGINWGDEGKGKMVDMFSQDYDVVCRYQGGNNAGHTVVNDRGKFVLNLLPSGILREGVVNVLGNGMAIDIRHLTEEAEKLRAQGVKITPENLKISDKAVITMPYHVLLDCLEEDRLKDKKFGSTRRGIAPVYADKYMKKDFRMGDLLDEKGLFERAEEIAEWKNLTIERGYGHEPVKSAEIVDFLLTYGRIWAKYITDVGEYLTKAHEDGKKILFEAQLGALRDIDFGIYPYTSSSSTIAAYAPIGAGVPGLKLDRCIGIMKAYSSCVGEGPFVAEYFGEQAEKLRAAGGEYGAATGRPRRVGPFDVVASSYGIRCQGADEVVLTKLDILSIYEEIEVCTGYALDGKIVKNFPCTRDLLRAKPVFERRKGWMEDISKYRTASALPPEAINYIRYIEDACKCKISYVAVGAERDAVIKM